MGHEGPFTPPPHSVAAIERALLTGEGLLKGQHSKVMIERGGKGKQPVFFYFKDEVTARSGPKLPREILKQMHENGCFKETFKHNIAKDWRRMSAIRKDVSGFHEKLSRMRALYARALRFARSRGPTNPSVGVQTD